MKRGFSLIELVISTVIISIAALSIAFLYQQALSGSLEVRELTVATALAKEKMEEVLLLDFGSVADVSDTSFPAPFSNYSYAVNVCYVQSTNLDSCVDPTTTDYKKVEVVINCDASPLATLKTLFTNY
ncbi:MAG: type II secretion system protein [Candidatus Omnitrophota bacterium]|nr:MAG: type II secretion system protein [Candidatus Omnitrophota bacterium]